MLLLHLGLPPPSLFTIPQLIESALRDVFIFISKKYCAQHALISYYFRFLQANRKWIKLWFCVTRKKKSCTLAEDGFDPSTSGLWAQHASAAPLCYIRYGFPICISRHKLRFILLYPFSEICIFFLGFTLCFLSKLSPKKSNVSLQSS